MTTLDNNLMFEPITGTAITVTANSTNVLDLLNARDLGIGNDDNATPRLLVRVLTAFTAAGAATLTVAFQGAPDDGTGNPGTYATYATSGALALADLAAGALILRTGIPAVPGAESLPRFYRLAYTVATGPMTAGALTAGITLGHGEEVYYPSGFTVAN